MENRTRAEEEIVAAWGATLERQYLAQEEPSDNCLATHIHAHGQGSGDSAPRRSLSDLEGSDGLFNDFSINASQHGTNYSMPTRNLSDLEGSDSAESTATANGSILDRTHNHPDNPLIDLGQEVPVVVNVEDSGSLSDKLTGDGSSDPEMGAQPISRPVAFALSDRCATPQRSNIHRNPHFPASPGTAQHVSEVFHHTYEADLQTSPVPPFVVVPSSGVAKVTIRPTARVLQNDSTSPAQQSRNQVLYKKACLFTLLAILILALITLAAGIVKAGEQVDPEIPLYQTPQQNIPGASSPTMPESTPVPSVATPVPSHSVISSPTASPVFSIPNEDTDVDFPDLGGGVVGREDTPSPTSSDYVPPTRPPRTRRPTASPSVAVSPYSSPFDAQSAEGTSQPSSFLTNSTTESPSYDAIEGEYEANMRAYLHTLIASISPASSMMLDLPLSPQQIAFEWLVLDQMATDPILSEDRIIQRFALAVFYFSTSGMNWTTSTLWLTLNNECDWYETRVNSVCDENGNMHTLEIEDNGLSGSLPLELSLLPLRRLFLRNNRISGTIPSELASLERLKLFQLTKNILEGSIPTEFGNLTSLVVLGVGRNEINGTIPTELGLLSSLDTLGLEGNKIEGPIPTEFGTISTLRFISMRSNFLSGGVPSEIGNLPSLDALKVEENDLSGSMPPEVCSLTVNSTLSQLTADCDEIWCECCTNCPFR